ncbi:MAG: spore maturation protein A, partial [Erysipelotrichaceae bacterium]|nr:spore maturation protein A [Erysipelotrichaceae bacterium]
MSILWLCMIAFSILYGLSIGKVDVLNNVFLNIGKETFDFVLPLVGMSCFWNGLLNVANGAGVLKKL